MRPFDAPFVDFVTNRVSYPEVLGGPRVSLSMPPRILAISPLLLSVLLFSTPLFAEGELPAVPRAAEPVHGLELMLRPAVGAAAGTSPVRYQPSPVLRLAGDPGALLQGASPYGAGFIGQAFLGYRFHPLISGGLRAGLRQASTSALSDGSTNLSRSSWDAGFYVRAYPLATTDSLRGHFDPWFSLGIEYLRDTQTFQRAAPTSTGTVNADWKLDHHAIAVPIAVGIDYRVLPLLSIGPSFEYTVASGVTGCVKLGAPGYSSNNYCSDSDPGKQAIKANSYGVWSLGLDLKLTVF